MAWLGIGRGAALIAGELPSLRVGHVADERERLAALALRYSVFVEEGGRFQATARRDVAMHEDADDATGRLLVALMAGRTVGTLRYHHGAATGIPSACARKLELHRLASPPFAEIAVLDWLAIASDMRGSHVPLELLRFALMELRGLGTRLAVIQALDERRLIAFYRALGFRPYLAHPVPASDGSATVPMAAALGHADGRAPR